MGKALDLTSRSRSIVTEATTKLVPLEFLKASVAGMSREDVEALAVAYLYGQVKNRARTGVLTTEREAERVPAAPEWEATYKRNREAAATRLIEQEQESREQAKAMWADVNAAMDRYKEHLRMEWTRELLDSEFALGDGTTVRWGDATKEQHEYRYGLHKRNAVAGLEGAARHQQAIQELEASGCQTLREAVSVAA